MEDSKTKRPVEKNNLVGWNREIFIVMVVSVLFRNRGLKGLDGKDHETNKLGDWKWAFCLEIQFFYSSIKEVLPTLVEKLAIKSA